MEQMRPELAPRPLVPPQLGQGLQAPVGQGELLERLDGAARGRDQGRREDQLGDQDDRHERDQAVLALHERGEEEPEARRR